MDALAAIRNEETRLHTAGLLQSSSALAVRSPAPPPTASSSVAPSSRAGGSDGLHCKYCDKDGQVEDFCYRKKKAQAQARRGGSAGSSGTGGSQKSSAGSETQEILMLLRRLATSASPRAAGFVTPASAPSGSVAASQSCTEGLPSTSAPGTCPWILDSGAFFYMTHDRTSLSSISNPSIPITVHTVDGSPLSVIGRGTLLSNSFHVPAVSYLPRLIMQLISAGQLTDHGCCVILDSDSCVVVVSFSTRTLVVFKIAARIS
uniref:Retrovirus-related Pol polyprotein from transposon TNT 1-94-like beta-barrel domain-containing protein n=1 Tax=Arundo donax TaxID=35708 RepID=A0A0A9DF52_ARUDO